MPDLSCCEGLGYRLRELENGGGGPGTETEIDLGFTAQDWAGGQVLTVIRSGVPILTQIGPHGLPAGTYNVSVYRFIAESFVREVSVNVQVNRANGLIYLWKAARTMPFSGRVVINYAKPG